MKPIYSLLVIASCLIFQAAQADDQSVCGQLRKISISTCGLEGCVETIFQLYTSDRGLQPYLIQFSNDVAQKTAFRYANNANFEICLTGAIGAGGDPGMIEANSVRVLPSPHVE